MKKERFSKILHNRVDQLLKLVETKGGEYTAGLDNQFHNFDTAAEMDSTTPEKALWGMLLKHLVSVKDMIDSEEPQDLDMIDEKIGDIICYFALLEGIMIRRADPQTKNTRNDIKELTYKINIEIDENSCKNLDFTSKKLKPKKRVTGSEPNRPEVIYSPDDELDQNVLTNPKKKYIRSDLFDKLDEKATVAAEALTRLDHVDNQEDANKILEQTREKLKDITKKHQ